MPKVFLRPHTAEPEKAAEPDADGWIQWNGGACPVGKMTKIRVRFRRFQTAERPIYPDCLDWAHNGGWADIVAYQVQAAEPTDTSLAAWDRMVGQVAALKITQTNQPGMLAEAVGRWRTEATTQRYARRLSEARLEIATDLLREADEYREQPLPDDLRARIDRFLHAADTSKCGTQGENCRLTSDPHDGTPVCMTCDARGEVRLEGCA